MKSVLILLLIVSQVSTAVEIETDRAAALVDGSQMSVKQQTQKALASVISKKSGWSLSNVLNRGIIDDSFESLILRNYYQNPPMAFANDKMWFSVVVDEDQLRNLMIEQRIPVWPDNRNSVYVWVVEEFEDGTLVNASPESEVYYWLNQWFVNKGVPAEFYDYQADDLLAFQPSDVRFMNPDLIDYIEQNHEVSATLLVFLKHTRSGYTYRYGFAKPEQQTTIKTMKFVELSSGLETLASEIQRTMSEGQQVFADEFVQSTVSVKINDLVNPDQVLLLLDYFDNHALIDGYHVNQYQNGQITVMMNINVLPDTFVRFVSNEQFIEHLPLDLGNSIIFSMAE